MSDPWCRAPEGLPREPGAYALLLTLAVATRAPPSLGGELAAGRTLYLGSALGPGGIRGRCRGHLGNRRRRHWHVDWLTAAGEVRALAVAGTGECDLVAALLAAGASVPVAGFGSSDCRRCPAHLLAPPPALDAAALAALLRQ